jgi:hypothetical protein
MSRLATARQPIRREPASERWIVVLTTVLLACLVGWRWWDKERRWTKEKAEAQIKRDLPRHSSREEIEAWLDERRIPHDFQEGFGDDAFLERMLWDFIRINPKSVTGTVSAEIPRSRTDVDRNLSGTIKIYFFFDKDGKCVWSRVYAVVDDPSP